MSVLVKKERNKNNDLNNILNKLKSEMDILKEQRDIAIDKCQ